MLNEQEGSKRIWCIFGLKANRVKREIQSDLITRFTPACKFDSYFLRQVPAVAFRSSLQVNVHYIRLHFVL